MGEINIKSKKERMKKKHKKADIASLTLFSIQIWKIIFVHTPGIRQELFILSSVLRYCQSEFLIIKEHLFSICFFFPFKIISAIIFPIAVKSVDIVVIPLSTTFFNGVSL